MKISEMIEKLQNIQNEFGDVEVLVTDGYQGLLYSGAYDITTFVEKGTLCADIGIGGCLDE